MPGKGRATAWRAQCPGLPSPVRVHRALVPLDAWGRVPDGHALQEAGVISWHLDFADPWRSCWGSHKSSECCDQRKSTSPMLWFPFHATINQKEPLCYTHAALGWLCALWVLSWKQPDTPTNYFFQLGSSPGGNQDERMDKHLHFREMLKVTDSLVTLWKA